jgi:hypothetical protein
MNPRERITDALNNTEYREREELIQQLQSQLAAEQEKNRWIPVGERLPEAGQCLVLCDNKTFQVSIRVTEDDEDGIMVACGLRDYGTLYLGFDECITHWRPIDLPKGE